MKASSAGARRQFSGTKTRPRIEKPRLHKVILLNDDYTPREFVVAVLSAVFHMGDEQAAHVMLTAHMKGSCVVAVMAKDIAESKADEANDLAARAEFPLKFTTEPEE